MTIDEVSARIGALEASAKAMRDTLSEHKDKSEDRHKETIDKLDKVISLQLQTNGRVTNNEGKIAEITKDGGKLDSAYENGKDWKKTKNRAVGAVFGISLGGGAVGTTITNWFKFLQ